MPAPIPTPPLLPLRARRASHTRHHPPLRLPPATTKSAPFLECHVGAVVAAAAGAIAAALGEFRDGGLTPATKMHGGDTIATLFKLRQFLIVDFPDFDGMARKHGAIVLWEICGDEVSPATIDVLVDEMMDILAKVVRAELN